MWTTRSPSCLVVSRIPRARNRPDHPPFFQSVWPSQPYLLLSSAVSSSVTFSVVPTPSPSLPLVKRNLQVGDRLSPSRLAGRPMPDLIPRKRLSAPTRRLLYTRSFTTTSPAHRLPSLHHRLSSRRMDPDLLLLSHSQLPPHSALSLPNVRRVGTPLPRGSTKRLMSGIQGTCLLHPHSLHSPLSHPPRVPRRVHLVLSAFPHRYYSRITSTVFTEAIRLL